MQGYQPLRASHLSYIPVRIMIKHVYKLTRTLLKQPLPISTA